MKKNHQLKSKRNVFVCLGITLTLLAGFSACDFEPSKIGRAIGGSLAEGEDVGNEFIENAGSAGESSGDYKQSGDLALPLLTKQEIRSMIKETDQSKLPANVFAVQPNYTAPYAAGKLNKEALDLALARLNMIRRLCGLPSVVYDEELNDIAQHGAVLATTGVIDHYLPNPGDMEDAFFKRARSGTEQSNMHGYNLIMSIDDYMPDPGAWGKDLGHRWYQISPGMAVVGFGYAQGPKTRMCEFVMGKKGYSVPVFDWDFVGWPAPGLFPTNVPFFHANHNNNNAWSIQLNSTKYSNIVAGTVSITLTRLSDGATWNSDNALYFTAEGLRIIFRPNGTTYADGDVFEIRVKGLKDKAGNPVDFAYKTEFFIP